MNQKEYAKRIIKLCKSLPENHEGRRISDQLFRAGTSVGANYRAAGRSRSKAEFISKPLMTEGNEIVAILVASINTSKRTK